MPQPAAAATTAFVMSSEAETSLAFLLAQLQLRLARGFGEPPLPAISPWNPFGLQRGLCSDASAKPVAAAKTHVNSRVNNTCGILLRKRRLSDTSLIVSWCTNSMGVIQTVARGARRPKSPFAGRLDLFFEAELSIAMSRKSNLHTLREVAVTNPFAGIRTNYLRTETASYFVELIEICTETEHHEPEIFNLLQRAFGYLAANDPSTRVISHFETELARIAGVHGAKSNPAVTLANLFGKLPPSRARLLKQVTASVKAIPAK
jgi:DNA repair protein RecO (recombination protein O)